MAITARQRRMADALPHREKRRLRRNLIMWEGRLERSVDHLTFLLEERKLPKKDRMLERSAKEVDEEIERAEYDVAECRAKLRKAKDQINAAIGTRL